MGRFEHCRKEARGPIVVVQSINHKSHDVSQEPLANVENAISAILPLNHKIRDQCIFSVNMLG